MLQRLRSLRGLVVGLDVELGHVLAELEEKEGFPRARDVYLELEKTHVRLETFQRHIWMEVRAREMTMAKALFDTALHIFAQSPDIVTALVVDYAQFAKKEFRDVDFGKKVFRVHFEAAPLQPELFMAYVDYLLAVDAKEGSREFKDLSGELMELVTRGLKRARLELGEEGHQRLSRVMLHKIRCFFPTIYSLKLNERRVREAEGAGLVRGRAL